MEFQVDVWVRGDNHATTEVIAPVARAPREWTDGDVAAVLVGMLRALDRAKNPEAAADRPAPGLMEGKYTYRQWAKLFYKGFQAHVGEIMAIKAALKQAGI